MAETKMTLDDYREEYKKTYGETEVRSLDNYRTQYAQRQEKRRQERIQTIVGTTMAAGKYLGGAFKEILPAATKTATELLPGLGGRKSAPTAAPFATKEDREKHEVLTGQRLPDSGAPRLITGPQQKAPTYVADRNSAEYWQSETYESIRKELRRQEQLQVAGSEDYNADLHKTLTELEEQRLFTAEYRPVNGKLVAETQEEAATRWANILVDARQDVITFGNYFADHGVYLYNFDLVDWYKHYRHDPNWNTRSEEDTKKLLELCRGLELTYGSVEAGVQHYYDMVDYVHKLETTMGLEKTSFEGVGSEFRGKLVLTKVLPDINPHEIQLIQPGAYAGFGINQHFDDGYQFGDLLKTAGDFTWRTAKAGVGTAGDLLLHGLRGGARLAESLADLGGYGIAGLADLFGADRFADNLRKNSALNAVNTLTDPAAQWLDQWSIAGDSTNQLVEVVAQAYTLNAIGSISYFISGGSMAASTFTTTMVTFGNGMGSGMSEALNAGATIEQATTYGLIIGTVNAVSELLFAGLGKGGHAIGLSKSGTALDDWAVNKLTSHLKSEFGKTLTTYITKAGFEGLEEVIGDFLINLGTSAMNMDEETKNKLLSGTNAGEDFAMGFLTSLFFQSVSSGAPGSSEKRPNGARAPAAPSPVENSQPQPLANNEQGVSLEKASDLAGDTQNATTPAATAANPVDLTGLISTVSGGDGTVTNSQATRILNDPAALEALRSMLPEGLTLPGTASGNRAAIKQAILYLAGKGPSPTSTPSAAAPQLSPETAPVAAAPDTAPVETPAAKTTEPLTPADQAAQKLADLLEVKDYPRPESKVDTAPETNYNNTTTSQGGNNDANIPYRGGSLRSGGVRGNTQTDSQGKNPGSGSDGLTHAPVGSKGRTTSRGNRGNVHTSDSEGRALTQEQAAKLQETAILDDNGAPLAVYHSTDNLVFSTFEKGDTGFHFGTANQAARLAKQRNYSRGRTFRVYLDIKNPYHSSRDIMGWYPPHTALLLWSDGVLTKQDYTEIVNLWQQGDGYDSPAAVRLREMIESKGYDGIAYPNGFEGDGLSYMAFHDSQIIRSEITPFSNAPSTFPNVNPEDSVGTANPSVGAADAGFTGLADYDALLSDDNVQPARASDAKHEEAPILDSKGRAVSETAANIMNSDVISERDVDALKKSIAAGDFGHDVQHMDQVADNALKEIRDDGINTSVKEIRRLVERGRFSEHDVAKASVLFSILSNREGATNQRLAGEMATHLAMMGTTTGRQFNMFKLIRKLSPDGKLQSVMTDVNSAVDQVNKGRRKKVEVEIPEQLQQEYLDAARADAKDHTDETQQALDEAAENIYAYTAASIPATIEEMYDAWRHMAMLGNLKTQGRNILGNLAFHPAVEIKRVVGALIEQKFVEQDKRTKSIIGVGEEGRALLKWAKSDAEANSHRMDYTAATGDDAKGKIADHRKILPGFLDTASKKLSDSMSAQDMFFKKWTYSNSLAGFLKARGYTASQIQSGKVSEIVLDEARAYAVNEAMKATFNDRSTLAQALLRLRYKGTNPLGKAWKLIYEGKLPYITTPANVATRAAEYSPFGLLRSATTDAAKVRSGEISAATYIDNLSAGLTGTGMFALGMILASGIFGIRLRGKVTDEDEKREGHQSWALEGDDWSYSLEWMAPANIPILMGANIWERIMDSKGDNDTNLLTAIVGGMSDSFSPLIELSTLRSVKDVLEDYEYAPDGQKEVFLAANFLTSYFTQGIPTLFGQAEQAFEPEKKTPYSDSDDPFIRAMERQFGRIFQRLPGDPFQETRVDEYGNVEKEKNTLTGIFNAFLNPGKISFIDQSPVTNELSRLNGVDGISVSPPDTPSAVTYKPKGGDQSVTVRLTAEQRETFGKVRGSVVFDVLSDVFESPLYKSLSDEQKAAVVSTVYDYARDTARIKVMDDYPGYSSSWMEDISDDPASAILNRSAVGLAEDALTDLRSSWKANTATTSDSLADAWEILSAVDGEDRETLIAQATGTTRDFLTAMDAGVSPEAFHDLYKIYNEISNTGELSPSQQAVNWGHALDTAVEQGKITREQRDLLFDSLVFMAHIPQDAERYNQFIDVGLSADESTDLLSTISSLVPHEGKSQASDAQKFEAIVEFPGLTPDEQDAILRLYMDDGQEEKYDKALVERGITAEAYVKAYLAYQVGSNKEEDLMGIRKAVGSSNAEWLYRVLSGRDK